VNKVIFLRRLQRERDRFELLLNQVGFTRQMTVTGVSGVWSIKDILAHVFAYEQYMADRMEEIHNNRPYIPCKTQNALGAFLQEFGYPDFGSPLLDDDEPNTWIVERYKNVPLEEIVSHELHAYATILHTLEKMPEDVILKNNLYERVANNTFRHYQEHMRDIKHWLMTRRFSGSK
jgi:hypothetical protein